MTVLNPEPQSADLSPDLEDELDQAHFAWIANTIAPVSPFAELEARLDEALRHTTFVDQLAIMDEDFNLDPATLPPPILEKYERVFMEMAATALAA